MSRFGWSWRSALLLGLVITSLAGLAASAASAVTIHEFSGGLSGGVGSGAMTAGPDGNVWFLGGHSIDRITPSGAITQFTAGLKPGSVPFDLSMGSDGNLWFSDNGTTKAIGRITPAGVITEFTEGLNPGSVPQNVVLGPDGNLWFLDLSAPAAIGRVTPAGAIKEFTGLNPMSKPNDITAGADGDVWFTDEGDTKAIGRVSTAGAITESSTGLINPAMSFPNDITAGPDGNVWFTDDGSPSAIGRVMPNGAITEFDAGLNEESAPDSITAGPDGNVWFADQANKHRAVGRVTPSGAITEFGKGLSTSVPDDITVGADGNLWIEQSTTGAVARITPAGAITEFTAGFDPMGGADGDEIVSGPDGNLWFTDRGEPNAIGKVLLELPEATTVGTAGAASPLPPAPKPQVLAPLSLTKAIFGNQQITLTTPAPGVCIASTKALAVTLNSTAIPKSPAAKLRYFDAAFLLDRGVKHRRKVRTRSHGRTKTVIVTVYTPNALARHVPASESLRLAGLLSGAHTLKVKITYEQTVTRHGRKRIVSVAKALSTPFHVC